MLDSQDKDIGELSLTVTSDDLETQPRRTKARIPLIVAGTLAAITLIVCLGTLANNNGASVPGYQAVRNALIRARGDHPRGCDLSNPDAGCGEEGNEFEGDIIAGREQINAEYGNGGVLADAARATKHWPNGVMYYTLNSNLDSTKKERIDWAMNHIRNSVPGVTFKRRGTQSAYVDFFDNGDGGCSSSVGRTGSKQTIKIADWCQRGSVVHEILHALGFWHEQSRPDRDNYVTINWNKIESGKSGNFDKKSESSVNDLDYGYDYGSIMHYGKRGFSIDGSDTITPRVSGASIGQRDGLSKIDIGQLQAMYKSYIYELRLTTCDKASAGTSKFVRFTLIDKDGGTSSADIIPPPRGKFAKYPIISKMSFDQIKQVRVQALSDDGWCSSSIRVFDTQDRQNIPVSGEANRWYDDPCSSSSAYGGDTCYVSKTFSMSFCYRVTIQTAMASHATTNAAINIDLYGSESTSPLRFTWDKSPAKLAISTKERCTSTNRGPLDKLTVRWSSNDAWGVSLITAQDKGSYSTVTFLTGTRWFDGNQQWPQTTYSSDTTFDAKYKYRLKIRTCDRTSAETTATLSFYIKGDYAQSATKTSVPPGRNDWKSLYFYNSRDLGRIESVFVKTTSVNGWCVSDMEVYDYQKSTTLSFKNQLKGGTWFDKPCSGSIYDPAELCFSETRIDSMTRYRLTLKTCDTSVSASSDIVEFGVVGGASSHVLRVKPPPRNQQQDYDFMTQNPLGGVESIVITATGNDGWCARTVKVKDLDENRTKDFTNYVKNYWFDKPCTASLSPCVQSKRFP